MAGAYDELGAGPLLMAELRYGAVELGALDALDEREHVAARIVVRVLLLLPAGAPASSRMRTRAPYSDYKPIVIAVYSNTA